MVREGSLEHETLKLRLEETHPLDPGEIGKDSDPGRQKSMCKGPVKTARAWCPWRNARASQSSLVTSLKMSSFSGSGTECVLFPQSPAHSVSTIKEINSLQFLPCSRYFICAILLIFQTALHWLLLLPPS